MRKAAALKIIALKNPIASLGVKELKATQTLNLTSGLVGTIITDMIQYALKEEGVNDNLKKRYAEGKILRG